MLADLSIVSRASSRQKYFTFLEQFGGTQFNTWVVETRKYLAVLQTSLSYIHGRPRIHGHKPREHLI